MFTDKSIKLENDDEDNGGDMVLNVLKLPPPHTPRVVRIRGCDILDGDKTFALFMAKAGKNNKVSIEEKTGVILEYIEGVVIVFSKEIGLVLFQLDNDWVSDAQLPSTHIRDLSSAGTFIKFTVNAFWGTIHSKALFSSRDSCMVWTKISKYHEEFFQY